MAALTKVWPTLVITIRPPASATTSGTAREVILLHTIVPPGSRRSSWLAIIAVTAEGLTTTPCSSMMKHRSASPSKTRARSAP